MPILFVKNIPILVNGPREIFWVVVLCVALSGVNVGYNTAAVYLPLGRLAGFDLTLVLSFVVLLSLVFFRDKVDMCQVSVI